MRPECHTNLVVCIQELDESICGVERTVVATWSPREPATGHYRTDPGGPCQLVGDPTKSQWQVDSAEQNEFVSLTVEVR